jgi:hypothetical protein
MDYYVYSESSDRPEQRNVAANLQSFRKQDRKVSQPKAARAASANSQILNFFATVSFLDLAVRTKKLLLFVPDLRTTISK